MARNKNHITVPSIIGVGGLFDILGGKTPEGPGWLRKFGLMWLYRFLCEPKRLWKRYSVTNIRFLHLVFKNFISGKKS